MSLTFILILWLIFIFTFFFFIPLFLQGYPGGSNPPPGAPYSSPYASHPSAPYGGAAGPPGGPYGGYGAPSQGGHYGPGAGGAPGGPYGGYRAPAGDHKLQLKLFFPTKHEFLAIYSSFVLYLVERIDRKSLAFPDSRVETVFVSQQDFIAGLMTGNLARGMNGGADRWAESVYV